MSGRCLSIRRRRAGRAGTRCPWAWPCVSAPRRAGATTAEGERVSVAHPAVEWSVSTCRWGSGGKSRTAGSLLEVSLLGSTQLGRAWREDVVSGRDDRSGVSAVSGDCVPHFLPSPVLPAVPHPRADSPKSGPPPRRQHKLLSRPGRDEVKSSQVHRPLTPFPLRPFQPTTPSSARKPASARRAGLWVSYSQSLRLSLHGPFCDCCWRGADMVV